MKVDQTALHTAVVLDHSPARWLAAALAWLFFLSMASGFFSLALDFGWMSVLFDDVGDGIPLGYPESLLAYSIFLLVFCGVAFYVTSWALDRGKRIIIDETVGMITVEELRWLFHGARYSLPLAAVGAVVIDNEPTVNPESSAQRVSMITDVPGQERVEVDSGKNGKMLSAGKMLIKHLHVELVDDSSKSGPAGNKP